MRWVCRQDNVIYRDHQWNAGDILETIESPGQKWDYSGGYWHLEGMKTFDPRNNNIIPRHFDPLDFSALVSKQAVVDAREGNKIPAKFAYPKKPEPAPLTEDNVQPLDPGSVKKTASQPKALTNAEAAKIVGGRRQ